MRISVAAIVMCIATSTAQAELSVDEFLRQAVQDTNLPTAAAAPTVGGLNRWLNDAQLRGTDDPNKHGYALRVSPKMPQQIMAEKSIVALRNQQRDLAMQAEMNDRLRLQYGRWLDLLEQRDRVQALDQVRNLAESEVQYQRNLAQTSDFQPRALLEAELSLARAKEQSGLQRARLTAVQSEAGIGPLPNNLVPFDEMLRVLASMPADEPGIEARNESLAVELAQLKLRADRARQGLALDLMQVERTTDDFTKKNSVGYLVGLRLPLGGTNFASAERQYDVIAARADLRRRTYTTQRNAVELRDRLNWQKRESDALGVSLTAIGERLNSARQSGDVAILLAVQREQLQTRERLTAVRHRAWRDYLDLLHLTGRLVQQPLRNWLTPGLPSL